MTAAKILIEIEEDGTLKLPPEALKALGTRFVTLNIEQGGPMTVEARPRRLSEIEDMDERMKALNILLDAVAIADAPGWPEDYDLRDDIYD